MGGIAFHKICNFVVPLCADLNLCCSQGSGTYEKYQDMNEPHSNAMEPSALREGWGQHSSSVSVNINQSIAGAGYPDAQTIFASREPSFGAIGSLHGSSGSPGITGTSTGKGTLHSSIHAGRSFQRQHTAESTDTSIYTQTSTGSQGLPQQTVVSSYGEQSFEGAQGTSLGGFDGGMEPPNYQHPMPFHHRPHPQQHGMQNPHFDGMPTVEGAGQGFVQSAQHGNAGMGSGGQSGPPPTGRYRSLSYGGGDLSGFQQHAQHPQISMSRQNSGTLQLSGSPTLQTQSGFRRQLSDGAQALPEYQGGYFRDQSQQQQLQPPAPSLMYGAPLSIHRRTQSEEISMTAGGGYRGNNAMAPNNAFAGPSNRHHLAGNRPGSAGGGGSAHGGRSYVGRARGFPPPPPPNGAGSPFRQKAMAARSIPSWGGNQGDSMGGRGEGAGRQGAMYDNGVSSGPGRNHGSQGQGYRQLWMEVRLDLMSRG